MLVIGEDEDFPVANIDIVFDALAARGDQDLLAGRVVGAHQPHFAGLVVAGGDDQPVFLRGNARPDPETVVLRLAIELDILAYRRSQNMQRRIVHAPIVVGDAIDQPAILHDPDEAGQRAGDCVGQQLAGLQILDPDVEPLGAVVVGRIGEIAPVVAHREGAEAEIFLALGERVLVEDQLRIAARHRLAVIFAIFRAFLEFGPVEIVALPLRNGGIVLLDPRLHLFEQRIDQLLLRLHLRFEPGVLGVQIGEHIRVIDRGIGLVVQPVVGIGNGDSVARVGMIALLGDRRRCRRGRSRRRNGFGHGVPFENLGGGLGGERGGERQSGGTQQAANTHENHR